MFCCSAGGICTVRRLVIRVGLAPGSQ
jgi:hypothetical protein